MSSTPPGWYDDGRGAQRWWDGSGWTENVQQPTAAPAGYPGASHPAAVPPAGAPQGTPPKRSKLWILWVVLGALVLLLGVLAAILIPMIVSAVTSAASPEGAVAAVERYDSAWTEQDCVAYRDSTTENYRESLGYTDCAGFEEQAALVADATDDYRIEVVSVETGGDGLTWIETLETYLSTLDEEGNPIEPEPFEVRYRYQVVETEGVWLVDGLEELG